MALVDSTTSGLAWGMQRRFQILSLLVALLWPIVLLTAQGATPAPPSQLDARSRTVFSQDLPRLDGSRLQVTTVEVTYPPGGSSAPHSHPCPVIGYVLKGAVRMQVKGGAASIYRAGDSFYEAPNGIHLGFAERERERTGNFPGLLYLRSFRSSLCQSAGD